MQISNDQEASDNVGKKEIEVMNKYSMLQQYEYVFPSNLHGLPPHREVNFSIELVPREKPTSISPYKMSTLELVELKLQLKKMLDKGYIWPS